MPWIIPIIVYAVASSITYLAAYAGVLALASSIVVSAITASSADDAASGNSFTQSLQNNVVTVRQAISHWQYIYGRTRVGGALTFMHEGTGSYLHLVITLAGHVSTEIESIYFNDSLLTLDTDGTTLTMTDGSGVVTTMDHPLWIRVKKSLGDEAGQPFPDLVAESDGKWTDAHRQSGRTKIYVRLYFDISLFPTGIPNITAIIRGKKVYDPRLDTTDYSNNATLCQNDFIMDVPAGLEADYDTEIDENALIADANICDEDVDLTGGGTEKRYTLNGAFMVNGPPLTPLGRMLTANSGKMFYIGGRFQLQSAAYVTPTITLSEADCRGVPHIMPNLSASDLFNGVKGTYISEGNFWQETDYPAVENAFFLSQDEGERTWMELAQPFQKSGVTAQRLGKIELERNRQQMIIEWPGKFNCFRLQPGNTVMLDFPMLGFDAKVFEVVQSVFVIEDGPEGAPRLGCDLTLRETGPSVYDWAFGEESTIDEAPNTTLPSPFTGEAPGAPVITETLYQTTGSAGVKSRVIMTWDPGPANYVLSSIPEYKLNGDSVWTPLGLQREPTVSIDDVAPGIYDFRVKTVNYFQVESAYSNVTTAEIHGLSLPPDNPVSLSITKVGGVAEAKWPLSLDLDVQINGAVVISHSYLTTGAGWNDGVVVVEYPGGATSGRAPLITGTYMIKFRDSSGNYSVGHADFVAVEGTLSAFTTVATVTENPTYAGSKTGLEVASSNLQLDTSGLTATIGTYLFDGTMDHGTVDTRRYEVDIESAIFDTGAFIDDLIGDFDSWDMFDGDGDIHDTRVFVYGRFTNGDPAGSPAPAFTEWAPFWVSEFTARAAEFKCEIVSGSVAHNVAISKLAIDAKVPT